MKGRSSTRDVLAGLLGAFLLAAGAVSGLASNPSWCSGYTTNGTLTCTPYNCDPSGQCTSAHTDQEILWIQVPPYPPVPVTVTYRYCSCLDGVEDDCCHIVVITDPPPLAGQVYSRGLCSALDNCYGDGRCEAKSVAGQVTPWCNPRASGE